MGGGPGALSLVPERRPYDPGRRHTQPRLWILRRRPETLRNVRVKGKVAGGGVPINPTKCESEGGVGVGWSGIVSDVSKDTWLTRGAVRDVFPSSYHSCLIPKYDI